ncbi:MAG: Fic family protein [Desulfobacteraceae bacterium]|uniref:Fic family protein n=1 Tax=Candidatus Desulfaltia bathyphila TaxID=2841697 RepID=A0A8J6TCR0_9BACT|nr:Fic family protein [Candidatus Desulfaltia bathyphila]MBL7196024.1 Fic family protein [Desulfobacterales bacterium]
MLSDRINKLLARIDLGKNIIDSHRPFPDVVLSRLRHNLIIEWTYNSNAIEGNTLTLKETLLVLEDGLTIGKKSLKEHLEAINHKEAIIFVEELASASHKITERNINEIHSLILKEIDKDYAGRYRDIQVRISGSSYLPPDPLFVPELMEQFAEKWLANSRQHPVVQATMAHFELVSIHPFIDGNGRTARLLMNLILMKHGYFPAVILKNDRKKYYDTLEKGHRGKIDDFIFFVGRALERTINLYLEAIPNVKTNFLTLAEAAKISPYSKDYLNILARRGSIPAFKLKRNWLVSKEALEGYIKSHKKSLTL